MPYYGNQSEYGVSEYLSDIQNLTGINQIYIGSEPTDGKEANAVFDELQIIFGNKSDSEIANILNATEASQWSLSHQLLAHLESNLDGGNLFLNEYAVSYWRIYKKKSTDNQYKLISTVPNDINVEYLEITDSELANKTLYDFAIEGVSDSGVLSSKFEVTNVQLDFDGIWLVDKNTGKTFVFRYSINNPRIDTTFTNEKDRVEIKTFSKYPTVIRGQSDFERGTLECAIFEDDKTIYEKEQELKSFEGSDLVLKFDTGHMYPVDIYNITPTYITETDNKVATIKCDWMQLGEVV